MLLFWQAGRFAFRAASVVAVAAGKGERAMWETLREAIDEEMEADPTVLVMGNFQLHSNFQSHIQPACTSVHTLQADERTFTRHPHATHA